MAFSLTWLPEVLAAAGLKVAEVEGWKTRGRGEMGKIQGVICHHTAGSKNGNMPSLGLLIKGRSDLPGPLSQLGLGRDGTFYVIAAGRCNHAGRGSWQEITSGNGNFIGIEAENTGSMKDFPWPAVQMDAYRRGVAAILNHVQKSAAFCCGHREYALPKGRKDDPLFDMAAFRDSVAAILNGTGPAAPLIPPVEPAKPGGVPSRPTLRRGMKNELVKQLQRRLGVDPAGVFGPRTEAAVRAFQRDHGMVPDGIVGPKTWAALDAPAPQPFDIGPAPVVEEIAEVPTLLTTPAPPPPPGSAITLAEAHAVLAEVKAPRATSEWDAPFASAVQRALAELFLLNPADDVDGDAGPRTRGAWALFSEDAKLAGGGIIDPAGARRLIDASKDRFAFIGKPAIALEPDFEIRRNRRTANQERSVAALIGAGKAMKLTRAQIAYVLATAEHESDRFATLEEYASGAAYEGRADLGNTHPGDGRRFKGRGYVQLTGRNNYQAYAKRTGIRLLELPYILMNWPALSVFVILDGMMRGAYTGKRLDQFVDKTQEDFRGARRVVNGQDQAEKIAQRARDWLTRLP
ncbi:MAG TPA: peptidoglycan-binding protein [Longimicrobium sp.]|jgi:peptidoglycan hydrolase-like protein with peptidoglycan-binding domain|nr:peptidoglycan-binding protein [Longimicrobium sp.]